MISSLLLAALLLREPSDGDSRLEQKISLELKDAQAADVLQKLAELLGVTPILDPGLDSASTVSIQAREMPIGEFIRAVERAAGVAVRLTKDRMIVTKKDAPVRKIAAGEALVKEILADASLPRRPAKDLPRRPAPKAIELRVHDGTAGVVVAWASRPVDVRVSGCDDPVRIYGLGSDPFDGRSRVVLQSVPSKDGKVRLPRVAIVGFREGEAPVPVKPEGCREALVVLEAPPEGASTAPPAAPSGKQFMVDLQLIEVSETDEEVLTAPRMQVQEGQAGSIGSRDKVDTAARDIRASVLAISTGADTVSLTFAATVFLTAVQGEGRDPITVLLSQNVETVKLRLGETKRVTLSSRYGRGRSALVAEVKVSALERHVSS